MKLPSTFFNSKMAPDCQSSIIFHSNVKWTGDNNNHSPVISGIVKHYHCHAAFTLAQEVRNPLGHINLSVELLDSLIEDDTLKMYLEVIMRNSNRINDLVAKFLESNQVNEMP